MNVKKAGYYISRFRKQDSAGAASFVVLFCHRLRSGSKQIPNQAAGSPFGGPAFLVEVVVL